MFKGFSKSLPVSSIRSFRSKANNKRVLYALTLTTFALLPILASPRNVALAAQMTKATTRRAARAAKELASSLKPRAICVQILCTI